MRKSVRQILQLVVGTVISVSRDKANKVANYSQVTKPLISVLHIFLSPVIKMLPKIWLLPLLLGGRQVEDDEQEISDKKE